MKKQLFKVLSVLLSVLMLFSLAGCGTEEVEEPSNLELIDTSNRLSDGKGVENKAYKLYWNEDYQCVILESKVTGTKWSTVSSEFTKLTDAEREAMGTMSLNRVLKYQSPVSVVALDKINNEQVELYGFSDSIRGGNYSVEIKDNTITAKYYFKDINAIIPVDYTLSDEGVKVSVDANAIVEGNSPIYSINLAPMFCSVKSGTADSYLFYPSGSGALVDTSDLQAVSGTYLSEVYGPDLARTIKQDLTNQKNIYLPVFGAKKGSEGLFSVISSGQEQASLYLVANDTVTGYSYISAQFALRGYDYNEVKGLAGSNNVVNETRIWSEDRVKDVVYAVDFYPLSGEDASYTGMAKKYQKILFGDNDAAKDLEEDAYSLKFIGGTMQQKNFLGFPYTTLYAATTFSQAQTILKELSATGVTPNVQLEGFGETGLDISKPAGALKFGGAFGNKTDLNALLQYCKTSGIDSFIDFEVTQFSKGGAGYSATFDVAKTANGRSANQYYISKATQKLDKENYDSYMMLCRDCVIPLSEKVLKKIDKYSISGVSFASLSNSAYSDYDSEKFYLKRGMANDVTTVYNSFIKAGKKVAANGANAYAAVLADCIFDAPLTSSEDDVFFADVPFYQMVFKGKTEIAGESVNAGETLAFKQLKCIESGMSMQYTLYNTYDSVLTYSPYKNIYGAQYSDNKETIISSAAKYKDYYAAVSGKTITSHEIITDDVRATTFSGDTVVIVNYADTDYKLADGTVVPALSYVIG